MTEPPNDWVRTVELGNNPPTSRRQALRNAITELPRGVTWDLVIRHSRGCNTLEPWTDGGLRWCTCEIVTLDATRIT